MKIIGKSTAIEKLRIQIKKVAKTNASVLIHGESGTGKELVAFAIHEQSNRKHKEFVAVNCGAIPESLMESLLFGYEEGAFSGARKNGQHGLLETANEGTLFLDEAGEMPLAMQAKILRTLQNFKIRRVGSNNPIQLDVRIIAASNKNLREQVDKGTFREDLFYRLDVIPLFIPPLRERLDDIPLLVHFFLDQYNRENNCNISISKELLKTFCNYHWPGNIRELKNFIEYGICFCENDLLTSEIFETRFAFANKTKQIENPYKLSLQTNKEILKELLNNYGSSLSAKKMIAQQLGISLATLYRQLKKL